MSITVNKIEIMVEKSRKDMEDELTKLRSEISDRMDEKERINIDEFENLKKLFAKEISSARDGIG